MMKPALRFRKDGTFTIVQFTDIHWGHSEDKDTRTRQMMERLLELERPDLAVFTGDLIESRLCPDPCESVRLAVEAAERARVPWAAVFGNHDTEAGATREQLMESLTGLPLCLAEAGPAGVSGIGNYVLDVLGSRSSEAGACLYFLDSGSYAPPEIGGYDWIRRDQIEWYAEQSARRRLPDGSSRPALAFFHIPLPEYAEVWETGNCSGDKFEPVCSPKINSGFFSAMVENGDILGTFAGHDHVNDYEGELHGIRLCYGRKTGFGSYGRDGFMKGARVIRLRENVRDFETWLRLEDGSVVRRDPSDRESSAS